MEEANERGLGMCKRGRICRGVGKQALGCDEEVAGRGDFGSQALVGVAAERICGVPGSQVRPGRSKSKGKSVSDFWRYR
jgi:hypothetical protein